MSNQFDICVIGAGSAGLSVAAGAAQLGLKTALIEKGAMGGDCLNTGCVPSKALLEAAKAAHHFRNSAKFGITPSEPEIDFSAVKDHVFGVIAKIEPHDSQERFEGLGVSVYREAAEFINAHSIKVGDQTITSRYFVIATGSRAAIPPITGLDASKAFTNENIFDIREKPDHLVIIGGGPIGVEMAQAHKRLGCNVTIIDMGNILIKDDPDLVDILRTRLTDEGITLHEQSAIKSVKHGENSVSVTYEKNGQTETVTGSHLLVAAGRKPNLDSLNLEKAGIKYERTGITVDQRLRTSQTHIFAAGDVSGGPQFTHIAGYHAGIIIRNVAFKIPAKVDYAAMPWVTYTDPELANVGMTEAMAKEQHGQDKIKTVTWEFEENDRASASNRNEGMIKVTLMKNGKILGATIIGPAAGELIGLWGLAITKKMKIGDITSMIAPYPTLGEISKRAAGTWFTPKLFSPRTQKIVGLLQKLPFLN